MSLKCIKYLLKKIIQEESQSILVAAVNCWTVSVDRLEDAGISLFCGAHEMGFDHGKSRRKTDGGEKKVCLKLSNGLYFTLKNRNLYV